MGARPAGVGGCEMKIDKNLMQYSLYATVTGLLIYLGIATIQHIGDILKILGEFVDLMNPLLIALVIAYLLKPGVQRVEKGLERGPFPTWVEARYKHLNRMVCSVDVATPYFPLQSGVWVSA